MLLLQGPAGRGNWSIHFIVVARVHFLWERWLWQSVWRCAHWPPHTESYHGGHHRSSDFSIWWWCLDTTPYRRHQQCQGWQQRRLHHDQSSGSRLSEKDLQISAVKSQIARNLAGESQRFLSSLQWWLTQKLSQPRRGGGSFEGHLCSFFYGWHRLLLFSTELATVEMKGTSGRWKQGA